LELLAHMLLKLIKIAGDRIIRYLGPETDQSHKTEILLCKHRPYLCDGCVAGESIGAVSHSDGGGTIGNGHHTPPFGKTGTGLVVLGTALVQTIHALAPLLTAGTRSDKCRKEMGTALANCNSARGAVNRSYLKCDDNVA